MVKTNSQNQYEPTSEVIAKKNKKHKSPFLVGLREGTYEPFAAFTAKRRIIEIERSNKFTYDEEKAVFWGFLTAGIPVTVGYLTPICILLKYTNNNIAVYATAAAIPLATNSISHIYEHFRKKRLAKEQEQQRKQGGLETSLENQMSE